MTTNVRAATALTPLWFVLLSFTWGSSFLFIKLALDGVSPGTIVLFRLILGGLTLNLIVLLTRRRLPREWRLIGHLAIVAFLLCVLPLLLFAWAGQYIPSGLSAIYNATTPLMTLVISLAVIPNERLTAFRTFGVLLGAAGILIVLGPWQLFEDTSDLHGTGWAQLACLLGTASYGLAFAWMRRFVTGSHDYDAPTIAATQVGLAALMMLLPAPFLLTQPLHLDATIIVSLLILGILGSGLAYIWNTAIVTAWGATPASTVTYLSPLVGVALGILILGETITWNQPVGGVITILGILISQQAIAPGLRWRASSARRPMGCGR
ncbi:MAG: DMT family transporter [Microbacterium sp.]